MFLLYRENTNDASERTLRHRLLHIRLVIKPESRNFVNSLFKPLTFQPVSETLQINFLPPKTLDLYNFFYHNANFSGTGLLRDLVWSASACHRRGNRPRGVDGCAPVRKNDGRDFQTFALII